MADTEIPVIMRFLAETEDLQNGTEEVEEAAEDSIDELQRLAETASEIARQAVDEVAASYQGLKKEVQTIAAAVAAAGVATAVGIGKFGEGAVGAAQNFQDLRARLQGLTGDAESAAEVFAEAVDFAARTSFSVESIVAATSQLEAFGVGGKENLELVANIAAATGGRLEDVSLRVAKALSGSSEGFQALRDTAGLTGERLARFGANLSTASLVSVKTAEDIELATNALKELGRTEFAGSIERQADTLSGAISNAQDAVTNFLATIGESAVPVVTSLARGFANGVNAATEFIRPFAPLVTALGTFAAVAAAGVGAVAGFAIPFAGIIAQTILTRKALALATAAVTRFAGGTALLQAVQLRVAALSATMQGATLQFSLFNTASGVFSGSIVPRLVTGFGALRTAASTAVATLTPFAPLIAAASVLAAGGTFVINSYADAQERLGDALDESSSRLQGSVTTYREFAGIVEQLSGQRLDFGLDVGQTVEDTRAALDGLSELEIDAAVRATGKSLEELRAELDENSKSAAIVRDQMVLLRQALNNADDGLVAVFTQSEEVQKAVEQSFGDRAFVSVQELEKAIGDLNIAFTRFNQAEVIANTFVQALERIDPALQAATKSAQSLNRFLSFANRLDDVDQLRQALGQVDAEIQSLEANLLTAVGTLDRLELTQALGDPSLDKERTDAIKEYLNLLDGRASLEQKISSEVDKARQAEIKAYELVTERQKVLGDLTLEQERARVQAQLRFVEEGSSEEVAILKRVASLDEQIRRDRLKKTRELIEEQVSAVQDSLAEVRSRPNATSADVTAELRDSIASLEAFERASAAAFKDAPEDAEKFRDSIVQLKRELRTAEATQLGDQFRELQKVLSEGLDASGNSAQRLERVTTAIDVVKRAIRAGTVDQTAAEEYLAQLEERKLGINREITDEKLRQSNEIAQLEQRALEEEIRILELRKSAGETVDRELEASRSKLLQTRLDAIEKEKQAALNAGLDAVDAEKKASLQRQSVFREETTRRLQEQQKQQTGTGQFTAGVQSAQNASRVPTRSGAGGGQPQNFGQNAGGIGLSGLQFSGFGDFAAGFGVQRFEPRRPQVPRFSRIEQQVQREVAQRSRVGETSQLPDSTVQRIENNNFVIDGTDGDMVKQEMVKSGRKLVQQQRQRGLTSSSTDSRSPMSSGRQRSS